MKDFKILKLTLQDIRKMSKIFKFYFPKIKYLINMFCSPYKTTLHDGKAKLIGNNLRPAKEKTKTSEFEVTSGAKNKSNYWPQHRTPQ